MGKEDMMAALEAISKSGIIVKGDLVLEKKVDYEVANVEDGGIGIQIINGKDKQKESGVDPENNHDDAIPEEETSGDDNSKLNFFAPKKVLKEMLLENWFDGICINKELFHKEWRENLVDELMASEYGAYIARLWEHQDKIPTIKGKFIGTLILSGVLKENKLAASRAILGIDNNTRDIDEKKEASTLANYMGQGKSEPYLGWIQDYVNQSKEYV